NRAGAVVGEEHLLPVLPAIGRAVYAALGGGGVDIAEGRHEHPVRIAGIDDNAPDLLGGLEADAGPGFAAVGGLEHALALGELRARIVFASADIDHFGIRGRNR